MKHSPLKLNRRKEKQGISSRLVAKKALVQILDNFRNTLAHGFLEKRITTSANLEIAVVNLCFLDCRFYCIFTR